jgi:5-methylcytosine-specific restriction protein B
MENIKKLIKERKWDFKKMENPDFHFQKGQDVLNTWLDLNIPPDTKNILIEKANDYKELLEISQSNDSVKSAIETILTIISYCDTKAKDKDYYNQYDDNRTLARAAVRMNSWVKNLIDYKFNPKEVTADSILNAIHYLLEPENGCTALSEKHREQIAKNILNVKYNKESFIEELKTYFSEFNLSVKNPKNYTSSICDIFYALSDYWLENESDNHSKANEPTFKDSKWKELIKVVNKMNDKESILKFFNSAKIALNEYGLDNDNHVVYAATLKKNTIHLTIGSRYVVRIRLKANQLKLGYFIQKESLKELQSKYSSLEIGRESMDEGRARIWVDLPASEVNFEDFRESMLAVVKRSIEAQEKSQYRSQNADIHNPYIIKAALDEKVLDDLLHESDVIANSDSRNSQSENTKIEAKPLNQILFGPPGTGKTYNTINKALEIIGVDLTELSRKEIKQRYKDKIEEGQIVFTTFHQSMSYEDFVEGIKPQAPDKIGDPLIFEVEDGIFKQISIDAINSIADASKSKDTQEILNFSESFDKYLEEIEKQLSNEKDITLTTKNGGKVIIESISQQGNLLARHPGKELTYPVSKMRLSKLNKAFPDLSEIKNIDREFREVIGGSNATINWAVLNDIRDKIRIDEQPPSTENRTKEDKTQIFENFKEQEIIENEGEPFVLIIDEINRGNVSQIFGELITLIEDDKRLGKSESLRIKLPYSKSIFGVPPNLHIIGTMNTADRSVEALDTALRRRFAFKEMAPNVAVIEPAIIDGVQLRTLLSTINNRIEKLIDKDHKIGHAYFINIGSKEELKMVFKDKVIPLLEEYFFGDFGKIGLVLGDSFVMKNAEEDFEFASFEGYDDYTADDLKRKATYAIKDAAEWNFKSIYEKLTK